MTFDCKHCQSDAVSVLICPACGDHYCGYCMTSHEKACHAQEDPNEE